MVIAEKSSKSLKDCMDYVYYKLRTTEPIEGKNGKLTKVFNGISVNSWFSPMGITVTPEKDQMSYSPIAIGLRTKLQDRAKSASAVLGRRHFEIAKQQVRKDEVLYGSSILKTECAVTPQRSVKSASGRFCGKRCSSSSPEVRTKLLSQRPHTCQGFRPEKPVYDALTVSAKSVQIFGYQRKHKTSSDSKEKDTNPLQSRDFETEHQMRVALQKRVKSAPPSHRLDVCIDSTVTKCTIPLYWKTKSLYHRNQSATGTKFSSEDGSIRGSLWKPLMHDGGAKHKSGCPYTCKGCFRACLVSQDYMDKISSGQIQFSSQQKRYVKPKFYHRKIVEYAIANAQPIKEMMDKEKKSQTKTMKNNRHSVT